MTKTTSGKRRRIDRRDPNPGQMREGELDRQIVRLVYEYRILTQAKIIRLTGKSEPQIKRQLRRLYDHVYLERVLLPVTYFGAPPVYYILDRRGRDCLKRQGIADFKGQPKRSIADITIHHTEAVNEFRIEVNLAAQAHGYQVARWVGESEHKQDYDRVQITTKAKPVSLIPDGFFVVREPDKARGDTAYFLELDRATMPLKRFQDKVRAYVTYYKAGSCEKRFGYKSFRVLTVLDDRFGPGTQRLPNLIEATQAVPQIGKRFWFTLLSAAQESDPLTAPIWSIAGGEHEARLIT